MAHYPTTRRMLPCMERSVRPTTGRARAEALRATVRAIVNGDFGGNQQRAATALGVTRATVNHVLNNRTDPGLPVTDGLVAYLRRPVEEIVEAGGDLEKLRAPSVGRTVEVQFGALPGWQPLLEGARASDPAVPEWCWREVAEARVWVRAPVTALMVAEMARFVLRHVAPPSA